MSTTKIMGEFKMCDNLTYKLDLNDPEMVKNTLHKKTMEIIDIIRVYENKNVNLYFGDMEDKALDLAQSILLSNKEAS